VIVLSWDEAVLVYFKLKYPDLEEEYLSNNKEWGIIAAIPSVSPEYEAGSDSVEEARTRQSSYTS
jgi:hypothetical protein